jgi:hypothetical protein
MREAQHQANFEADMRHRRELHEAEKVAGDAVEQEPLMESLGEPTPRKEREPRKAKEAEDLTRRACYGKYTDARDSGGGSKKNYGWIPHNAGFGFLDRPRLALGVFASLDRF